MPEPDYIVYPRSLTCAICDDPACTGEHVLGDPWAATPGIPEPSPLPVPEPAGLPQPERWIPPERRDLE